MTQRRNERCACGSGLKFKACCLLKQKREEQEAKEKAKLAFEERVAKARRSMTRSIDPFIQIISLGTREIIRDQKA